MEKYYFVVNLVVYSIIPTLVALYVTERVKGSVKNSFDRKLEEVKKGHSLEISQFQTELNALKTRENFKFTKLHEERLEVLSKTYQYINEILVLLQKCILAVKDEANETDETFASIDQKLLNSEYVNAYKKFLDYFNSKAIYFDEDIEVLMSNYFEEAATLYMNHSIKQTEMKAGLHPNEDINLESYMAVRVKLKPIKKQIEVKFRELLGG